LRGGRVHAVGVPHASAILVERGVIAWVGDESGASALARGAGAVDETVALDGRLVTPAFVDAHVHLTATGLAAVSPDLSGIRSARQLLDAVAARARTLPAGEVVLGLGWDDATWDEPGRLPTRSQLATASGGRPVFLGRVDVHSALVTARPPGEPSRQSHPAGAGGGDSGAGTDDALVAWEDRPGAVTLPRLLSALLSRRGRQDLLVGALDAAAAAGIASLHEMAAPQLADIDDLALLDELGALLRPGDPDTGPPVSGLAGERAGPAATARPLVVAWWGQHAADGGIEAALAAGASGCGGDLCIDGSLGSRTAALLEPYRDSGGLGVLQLGPDEIAEHVLACARAGLRTGFHLIGDGAATAVADGLDRAAAVIGTGAVAATAPRLEHAEMVPRQAALGANASVQPAFATTWGRSGGMYEQRLGPTRASGMNAFADMAAAGMPMALGSDAPVTPLAGWSAVRDATAHPVPRQALGARAAFAAATRGGWRAAGRPAAGRLAVGSAAHLAVWDVVGGWEAATPDTRVARWSTDPASGVSPLPALGADLPLPVCRGLLVGGRRTGRWA